MNVVESGTGRALVFVHGAGCNHRVWLKQLEFFKDFYRVIAPDLPGHGDDQADGLESVDKYALALREELKKRGLGQFILCGHSMGGAIAQFYALNFPEDLSGLILASTGARLRVTHQIFEMIEKDYNAFIELSITFSVAQEVKEEIKAKFREIISKCRPDVAFNDFKACNNFDLMEKVEGIKIPTLILCGENDLLTPVKYSKYLEGKIKGAKLFVFSNCGHMIMLERPEEFNTALQMFIKDL